MLGHGHNSLGDRLRDAHMLGQVFRPHRRRMQHIQ